MPCGRMVGTVRSAAAVLCRLVDDERGQDVIEYALLTAAVGVVSAATWPVVASAIGTAYTTLESNTHNLWEPPPPGGGS
jgi:Flp pilus assembly pilin Flp